MIFTLLLLFIAIILEASIITVPLTLAVVLSSSFVLKNDMILVLALLSGMLLDIITMQTVGFSSLFFLTVVFLVNAYEKKFESTNYLIFVVGGLASFLYLLIIKGDFAILSSLFTGFLSVALFNFFARVKGGESRANTLRVEI